MRPADVVRSGVACDRFPRPSLTMRELIGLVLAFAVSNAFLTWLDPFAASNALVFSIWNGLLLFNLGFAFVQGWIRSMIRWRRTGRAEPPGPPRRWTALGVAEATVIGGTMVCCALFLLGMPIAGTYPSHDWVSPLAILVIGSVAGVMVLRLWRSQPGDSLTDRRVPSTIETNEKKGTIERGELL